MATNIEQIIDRRPVATTANSAQNFIAKFSVSCAFFLLFSFCASGKIAVAKPQQVLRAKRYLKARNDMDLLDSIQCLPFSLSIEIGKIEYGWMEITLVSNYAFKSYDVSYLVDPISDILEKFILLCDDNPFYINPFKSKLNLAVVEHDLEGENIIWLLRKSDEDFYIYIWENIYEMEEWLDADFSTSYYYDYEELPNLTKNLLFSIKGKQKDFAKTLVSTLDKLRLRANENDCSQEWGYKFENQSYERLKTIV